MTREDVIRMAREAGISAAWPSLNAVRLAVDIDLERFAALLAAAEREACAKIIEQHCGAWDDAGYALSQAIRARGQE